MSVNRVIWVDLLKGVAIIWLIVYHMHVFGWMHSPVPIFFFLSGLFFTDEKPFSSFVKKKSNALLVPLLFFFTLGIVASVLNSFLHSEHFSFPPLWKFVTLIPADAETTNPMGVGAIWFLVSLFEVYIIYYGLRKVSKEPWSLVVISLILFIASCITMQYFAHGSLFYLLYTFQFFVFFIVAHLLRERVLTGKIPIWLLGMSILMYIIRFIDVDNLLNINQLDSLGGVISGFIWLISEAGLILVLVWLCKQISSIKYMNKSVFCRFLLFEGSNSLTILGVHMLIMGMVSVVLKKFLQIGWLYYITMFLTIILVSNICILLFNRFVPFLVNHKKVKS